MTPTANATELANHFHAFVVIVHHIGLADEKRLRGHTSLNAVLDASILCKRKQGELATVLTLQELKDDEDGVKFTAHLSRIVIRRDDDGDEVSTLIVDRVEGVADAQAVKPPKSTTPKQRLLIDVLVLALEEAGENIPSLPHGPIVRAVNDEAVRRRYYIRIAEKAGHDDTPQKMAERKRKAFNRASSPTSTPNRSWRKRSMTRGSYGYHDQETNR